MGCYDDVHGGNRCSQTKAFGKGFRQISIGDRVAISEVPVPGVGPEPVSHRNGQVNVFGGGWLIVRDGTWVAWLDRPLPGLASFDNCGRPVPHGSEPSGYDAEVVGPGGCRICRTIVDLADIRLLEGSA